MRLRTDAPASHREHGVMEPTHTSHLQELAPRRLTGAPDMQSMMRALQLCQHARHAAEDQLDGTRRALDAALAALADSQDREAMAHEQAGRDTLTGLPNRRAFGETTARTLAEHAPVSRGFCLLFLDLDDFKAINDRLGHAAGDELLKVVGERLVHAVRHEDRVCRHGGDEFLCLLPHVRRQDQARAVAKKLMDTVSAPSSLGGTMVQVRASVGIALYPGDGLTVPELVARADRAMYWSKAQRAGPSLASEVPQPFSLGPVGPAPASQRQQTAR